MTERHNVVVIGAGQAGLSVSHELTALGVEHVVLERGRVGQTWRGRWDSFCLVTPNWTVKLPGGEYDGDDPTGFMPRDEIVAHLERYARSFSAPVRERVNVRELERTTNGFRLRTDDSEIEAKHVVLSTGAYQRPHRPSVTLTPKTHAIDAEDYTNPAALPPGKVLVVGSGQTGCQIAEELHESGRDVFLACGRAPWIERRIEGRDFVDWLSHTRFFDMTLADLPSPQARLIANVLSTGHGAGHDMHYRTLQALGVELLGHLVGVDGHRAIFANDLADSVAFGDARHADTCALIVNTMNERGLHAPRFDPVPPFKATPEETIDLRDIATVIFTSGFRPDYTSWVPIPSAFDDLGFPLHANGASTAVPGLYFCGVHFLRKRKSSLFLGVGEDAAIVARTVADRVRAPARAS
jgi:putative flavoprotein involved in K+ transport